MDRVFGPTLDRIIKAKGRYIKDASKKIRKGARGALQNAEEKKRRESVPFDKKAMQIFNKVLIKLENGEGVSFTKEDVSALEVEVVEVIDEEEEEEDEEEDESDAVV
jgi:hypothetical protein